MRRKVFPLTEISLDDRRDLGDRDHFYPIWTQLSRLAGKLSVYTLQNLHHRGKLYPVSGKTFLHMNRTTLFDLSKCFLVNRDNFCTYEQALNLNSNANHTHVEIHAGNSWENSLAGIQPATRTVQIRERLQTYCRFCHLLFEYLQK